MRQIVLASLLILTACAGRPDINKQAASPELNLEEYFEGQTRGYGQFQDILAMSRAASLLISLAPGTAKPSFWSRTLTIRMAPRSNASEPLGRPDWRPGKAQALA